EGGNVDGAFLMIHNAMVEDERNHPLLGLDPKSAPAYLFASLDVTDPNNEMFGFVKEMKQRLDRFLAAHRRFTRTRFYYRDFQRKFLKRVSVSLDEEKFFFVYCLQQIINIEKLSNPKLIANM